MTSSTSSWQLERIAGARAHGPPPRLRSALPALLSPSISLGAGAPVGWSRRASSAFRTSSEVQPLMSRSAITSRWRGGQGGDRLEQHLAGGVGREPLVRRAPVDRRPGPGARAARRGVPWKRSGGTAGSSRPSSVAATQQREREGPALAFATGASGVQQDRRDPGLERRAPLEAVDPVEHREPRLLHDLLGHRAAGHVHHRQAHQHRPVGVDQSARNAASSPARSAFEQARLVVEGRGELTAGNPYQSRTAAHGCVP